MCCSTENRSCGNNATTALHNHHQLSEHGHRHLPERLRSDEVHLSKRVKRPKAMKSTRTYGRPLPPQVQQQLLLGKAGDAGEDHGPMTARLGGFPSPPRQVKPRYNNPLLPQPQRGGQAGPRPPAVCRVRGAGDSRGAGPGRPRNEQRAPLDAGRCGRATTAPSTGTKTTPVPAVAGAVQEEAPVPPRRAASRR